MRKASTKLSLLLSLILILLIIAPCSAQVKDYTDTKSDTTAYVILDTITLLFFLLGVFFAAQLYLYMKGGALMTTWRWLTGGIILLAILKILEIGQTAQLFVVEGWLIRTVYLIAAIFLASGFYGQKKALS